MITIRRSDEQTNGVMRDFLPQDASLETVSSKRLARIKSLFNNRPGKRLGD